MGKVTVDRLLEIPIFGDALLIGSAFVLVIGLYLELVPNLLEHTVKFLKHKRSDFFRKLKELIVRLHSRKFDYSPLPHRSCIRLLHIQPGIATDVVQCSLRVVNLDESPEYAALSYTWKKERLVDVPKLLVCISRCAFAYMFRANKHINYAEKITTWVTYWCSDMRSVKQESTRTVLCNGKSMQVSPNLYDALLQLRQSHFEEFWIDAICINQTDVDEKETQIQMMGRIYGSAHTVRVWLGTGMAIIEPGIKAIQTFRLQPGNLVSDDQISVALLYLLSRRWFRRLWVLQEACLARHIVFLLGEQELGPQSIIEAFDWLANPHGIGVTKQLIDWLNPFFGYIKTVPDILRSREEFKKGGRLSLKQWLQLATGRPPTDERDILYAGLGLIEPHSLLINPNLIEEPALLLPPPTDTGHIKKCDTDTSKRKNMGRRRLWIKLGVDIRANAFETYLNFAACLLSQPRAMDILSISARCSDNMLSDAGKRLDSVNQVENYPSWLPYPGRWTCRIITPLIYLGMDKYTACKNPFSNPRISADCRTLYIDAARIDIVENTYWPPDNDKISAIAQALPNVYALTGISTLQVLANVAVAGLWSGQFEQFEPLRSRVTTWRCVFTTKKGYIGLGPYWMNSGDFLMLVKGGSVPYLFRYHNDAARGPADMDCKHPNGRENETEENSSAKKASLKDYRQSICEKEGYFNIGEAYVEGMMFGEMEEDAQFERIAVR